MNGNINRVLNFFSNIIKEIEKQIEAEERFLPGREKKLEEIERNIWFPIIEIIEIKNSIGNSRNKLSLLKNKLKEINSIKEMISNGNYRSAIGFLDIVGEEELDNFLNTYIGHYHIEQMREMKKEIEEEAERKNGKKTKKKSLVWKNYKEL